MATVYYHHMGWGWGLLSVLGFLLLLTLVVAVALSMFRERGGATSREILDRRLASGEITVEEYERARAAMTADPPRSTPTGPAAT